MGPRTIRKQFKFGMFTVHNHDGEIWAEVNGNLYRWDENAGSGFPGAIQHSGNFLHGTEYRVPVIGGGDWVQYPHLEHGHVVSTRGLGYGSNFYPDINRVKTVLGGNDTDGWERKNPAPGRNDEWIPLTADNY